MTRPPGWRFEYRADIPTSVKINCHKQRQQPRKNGFYGLQPRHSKRTRELKLATRNVQTMLRPGKMNEIGKEILKYRLEVVALQEIRWQGEGRIDKKEFTQLYSQPHRRTGLYGTGFLVSKKIGPSIMEFEAINESIYRLKLRGRFRNVTILSVYAPHEGSSEEDKEQFYEKIEIIVSKIRKYDMVIIMGDFTTCRLTERKP
ncbi:hypothetical protein C0J52_10799 [Blattella germanica]|nr:hypothetical protein C0J52_10799 [Blattella germanica]